MYKILRAKLLFKVFHAESAFATTDRNEAYNYQRFIHVAFGLK